jgi:hypothetical protein
METRITKTTVLLLIVFIISLCTLLFLFYEDPTRYSPVLPKTATHKKLSNRSSLYFSPNSLTIIPGQTASIDIVLNTEGAPPEVAQLELAYDPNIITNVQIVPGNFFTNAIVVLQNINEKTGRISYVVEKSLLQEIEYKSTGTLATLNFKTIPLLKSTSLSFLPKTAVRTKEDINTLQSIYEAKIFIGIQHVQIINN